MTMKEMLTIHDEIVEANERKLADWKDARSFVVGKSYYPFDRSFSTIKIIKRTAKCVIVENEDGNRWRMVVKKDKDGIEFVTDSCVPKGWRQCFTYCADDAVEGGAIDERV